MPNNEIKNKNTTARAYAPTMRPMADRVERRAKIEERGSRELGGFVMPPAAQLDYLESL